jgi:tryptophan synthase alpha chain
VSFALLKRALATRARHVSPFLVLGDPDGETSVALAVAAVKAGATMLELGIPFSDPCADGPAIQKAILRARASGVSTDRALEIMAAIRAKCPETPFNLLVYGNLVHARGYKRFARDAVAAGASSLLVPDIPLEESTGLAGVCRAVNLGIVQMVAPSTPPARIAQLDAAADAFLYVTGHQGITGADSKPGGAAAGSPVARVRAHAKRPICLGFGLKTAEGVREAFASGAAIAVIGSHLARVIESAAEQGRAEVVSSFENALRPLVGAAV